MAIIQPESVEDVSERVKSGAKVLAVGARTKPMLAVDGEHYQLLDSRRIGGISEYEPTEFTFTAKTGTKVSEIQSVLKDNGQYLPFDPPFSAQGSTIGGAIASGMNGSSSLRFGGIRDFVLGVKYIDGLGNEIASGGKVVKNAAGFDMSKFMVGSYGRFGFLTEVTLKVFPEPESFVTLVYSVDLTTALDWIKKLILTPLEMDALDWSDNRLWIRIGGPMQTIETALSRIETLFGESPDQKLAAGDDSGLWNNTNSFDWHQEENRALLKIPCQINDVVKLNSIASKNGAIFRIALGGQVAYCSAPQDNVDNLVSDLSSSSFPSLIVSGPSGIEESARKNEPKFGTFANSVKRAVDPNNQFAIL